MRVPVIAGNWKMHKTVQEAVELVRDLKDSVSDADGVEIIVGPPFTALYAVAEELKGSNISVTAQNVFWEEKGAFTGEIAPGMLREAGCSHTIIGHSERRQYFGETDETVNKRIKAALGAGLKCIVCVGETLEQRESGRTMEVVGQQVENGLSGFSSEDFSNMIIAYEPVWAIGTGKTASPAQAEEVHGFIRGVVSRTAGSDVAEGLRILYGGSVKPENVDEIMAQENVDGALVGGASLKADSFSRIVKFKK